MNHTTLFVYLTNSLLEEFTLGEFTKINIPENSLETDHQHLAESVADHLFIHPDGVYLAIHGSDQWIPSDGREQANGVILSMKKQTHPFLQEWFTYDVVEDRWGDIIMANHDIVERGTADAWIDRSWQQLMHTTMDQWDRIVAQQCINTVRLNIQHDSKVDDRVVLLIEDRMMRLKRPLQMWTEIYTEAAIMMESPSLVRSDAYIIEMDHEVHQDVVWPTGTQVFRPLSSLV